MRARGPSTVGAWIFVIGLSLSVFLILGGADLFDDMYDAVYVLLLAVGVTLAGAVILVVNVIRARGR